jgi:ABC-type Fe3+ transport system permease subunit
VLVAVQSIQVAPPGQPARYGLDGWRAAFGEPGLRAALVNTFKVTLVRQLLSLPLAVLIAWLLARTDLPGRGWIEFAFWAAFFLPPFTVTLSWILLLDPEYGLVNTWLAKLPFVGTGPFNIYSFWGIVWVHVLTGSVTVKVILLTPAFRHMNASFEEASRVAGAGGLRTALRITVPVMAPAILSVLLLGTMVSLQTFEVEQVLGLPFRFFVFSTSIYDLLVTRVPRYDAATALSVVILAAMLPLVFAQQWLTRGTPLHHRHRPVPEPGAPARPLAGARPRVAPRRRLPRARRARALLHPRHLHEALRILSHRRSLDAGQLEQCPRRRDVPPLAAQHPRARGGHGLPPPSSCTLSSPTSSCARAMRGGGSSTSSRGSPSPCPASSSASPSSGSSSG